MRGSNATGTSPPIKSLQQLQQRWNRAAKLRKHQDIPQKADRWRVEPKYDDLPQNHARSNMLRFATYVHRPLCDILHQTDVLTARYRKPPRATCVPGPSLNLAHTRQPHQKIHVYRSTRPVNHVCQTEKRVTVKLRKSRRQTHHCMRAPLCPTQTTTTTQQPAVAGACTLFELCRGVPSLSRGHQHPKWVTKTTTTKKLPAMRTSTTTNFAKTTSKESVYPSRRGQTVGIAWGGGRLACTPVLSRKMKADRFVSPSSSTTHDSRTRSSHPWNVQHPPFCGAPPSLLYNQNPRKQRPASPQACSK